jgi:hypothetical protein
MFAKAAPAGSRRRSHGEHSIAKAYFVGSQLLPDRQRPIAKALSVACQ